MSVPKFDPKELEVVAEMPGIAGGDSIKITNKPLNMHDHTTLAFQRKPWWQAYQAVGDAVIFTPRIIPDNVARAFVMEATPFDKEKESGGLDMFGVDWEYEPEAGGSMVRPGNPFLSEMSEWREKIVWPDIDSWDWEGSAKANNGTYLKPENFNQTWFHTGYFERLISMLDFENAVMALFDEDDQEEVNAFFEKLTDFYIDIFDHMVRYFPDINAVFFHDDWSAQKDTFFSPSVCEEMIVPHMRRLTDFLHSKNVFCELHSCGMGLKQVPNMIKAGWDAWAPQLLNDSYNIYDLYGDQILIATFPQDMPANYAELSEDEQRRLARKYVNRCCRPGKPSFYNFYASSFLTPAFREEMYIQSRKNYSGENTDFSE